MSVTSKLRAAAAMLTLRKETYIEPNIAKGREESGCLLLRSLCPTCPGDKNWKNGRAEKKNKSKSHVWKVQQDFLGINYSLNWVEKENLDGKWLWQSLSLPSCEGLWMHLSCSPKASKEWKEAWGGQ